MKSHQTPASISLPSPEEVLNLGRRSEDEVTKLAVLRDVHNLLALSREGLQPSVPSRHQDLQCFKEREH